jgi:CBS domain-containing protein
VRGAILDGVDVATFLGRHAPFDELASAELDAIVAATEIVFYLRGEVIFEAGGVALRHVWVVRTGSIEIVDDGEVVDQATEGEVVGAVSMLSGDGPLLTARAHEETLAYRIDGAVAARAFTSPAGVGFLGRSLRRRERSLLAHVDAAAADPWVVPLGEVATGEVLEVPADRPVRLVAAAMRDRGASSALVRDDEGWAIVTDRDLRVRVLADGADPGGPVGAVASSPVVSLPADATAAEALSLMLERGIHHVPVTEAGVVRGIVTDTDLMALERRSVLQLRRELARGPTTEAVVEIAGRIPGALADLVVASMDPLAVAHLAGVLRDAATVRLLELTTERLGPAPCPWAWMTLGSQARYEQGIETDQDHALVVEPTDGADVDGYFAELGETVTAALEATGIPRCRAGVVAANADWRGSLEDWRARFTTWSKDPDPWSFGRAAIALDHRMLAGPLDADRAFTGPLRAMGRDPMVQRRLARWVVEQRAPRGFLRAAIVEGRGTSDATFDVKRQGIAIITSLARVVGWRAGVEDNRTGARLRAGAAAGSIGAEDAAVLDDAFRLLWQVRLDHQAEQVRRGLLPDDQVDPRRLGPLTRQALKEAFRRIEAAQQVLSLEMGFR